MAGKVGSSVSDSDKITVLSVAFAVLSMITLLLLVVEFDRSLVGHGAGLGNRSSDRESSFAIRSSRFSMRSTAFCRWSHRINISSHNIFESGDVDSAS
jgi:hypothetical protein